MPNINLFDLAYRHNEWLAQRQTLVASNVVNADTPGYRAKDLVAFERVMTDTMAMAKTNPAHISSGEADQVAAQEVYVNNQAVNASGNDVNLEAEFLKSGEVMRSYSINTQIIKAFHRMVLTSAKG